MTGFHCTIITPQKQVLDDTAVYASIPAWDGQIGLMRQRAPLMVKLGVGAMRVDLAHDGAKWFFLDGGYAQMRANRLTVLAQEAVGSYQISKQDAESAMKEAQAFVPRSDQDMARRDRDLARARTMLTLVDRRDDTGS